MKTALEILKTELGYDTCDEIDLDQIHRNERYIIKAMQTYASQALDAAANEVSLLLDEEHPYRVDDYPEHQRESLGDGRDGNILCYIDRESILKLKDQLK